MLSASRFERFVEAGVVEEDEAGTVRLTEAAIDAVETERDAIAELDDDAVVARVADRDRTVADSLAAPPAVDRSVAAEYLALREFLDAEDAASLLVVLDQFGSDPPPDRGVPDAFTPIHGDRLVSLAALFPRVIVYVWRDDCDPCDAVRADLDETFPEPPADVALLAVFGPAWADVLADAFDVVGGPTTLFVRAGRPDARLVGPAPTESLANEVRLLRE